MTKSKDVIDLDAILLQLGPLGRYQVRTYCLILLPIVLCAIHNSQYIFAAAQVNYRCKVPECESSPPEFAAEGWGVWALPPSPAARCYRHVPVSSTCAPDSFANSTRPCDAWLYEDYNSIVAEFDLACAEWRRTLVGTVHSAGMFTALCLTGYVSDAFGRRTALILTAVSPCVTGVARAFAPNYVAYLVLEWLDSTLSAGAYSTGFILALEMICRERRVLAGNIIPIFFALGQVCLALVAWAVPYWRTLTLVLYAPSVVFVLYYFVLEESVRWLLNKGRFEEAARIIFKAAAMNKAKLSPETVRQLKELEEAPKDEFRSAPQKKIKKERSLVCQVVHSRVMMSRLCICSFLWVTLTFTYYGLSINSVSLAGNKYVNYIVVSLVEIPGYGLSVLTLDRFGRKSSIMTAYFVCGVALIAMPFVPSDQAAVRLGLNLIGKLWICMAFGSMYIYTAELFPTGVRQSLLGACSMAGRVGQALAPQTPLLVTLWKQVLVCVAKTAISMVFSSMYIYTIELFPTAARQSLMAACSMVGRLGSAMAPQTPLLMQYMESLPYVLFGAMCAAAGALMLMTPETLRMRLPDTVAQAEQLATAPRSRRKADFIV